MEDQSIDSLYEQEAAQASDYAEYQAAQEKRNHGTIHYGFGGEYLPNWGMQQAFRELYQNFLDYGDYEEEILTDGDRSIVTLKNGWKPENLEYLRIGRSQKDNPDAIGHHGEGLKMAFLILLREGFTSHIFTNKFAVTPEWYNDAQIGDCFCFQYELHDIHESHYEICFECLTTDITAFKQNLISKDDIIYSHWDYGDLLSKTAGNIYSGGLFVANLKGISRSYNIKPRYLPLDRDRCVPQAFDVEYRTSKILEASEVLTVKDLSYSDTRYITTLPPAMLETVKPRKVGNSIEFTIKGEDGKDQLINNSSLKESLKTNSLFAKAIQRIKKFLVKQLGVYELLVQFRNKHVRGTEALQDFNIILERITK